jgi:hypothetical protein
MEFELEAIGEKLLHHRFPLCLVRHTLPCGFRPQIELLRSEPGGRPDDLFDMDTPGELDEVVEGGIVRDKFARSDI